MQCPSMLLFTGDIFIDIGVWLPNNRLDTINMLDGTMDGLQFASVFQNDRQVKDCRIHSLGIDVEHPRTIITVGLIGE